jgi:hypothetical protein
MDKPLIKVEFLILIFAYLEPDHAMFAEGTNG